MTDNHKPLPKAIHTSTLSIMGVDLVCHVLDNGERVFDAENLKKFFVIIKGDTPLNKEDAQRLACWVKGTNPTP